MYLIIDKATQTILHMSNAYPGDDKKPQDLLPGFDAATMDFGVAPQPFVPARFRIEDGVVKDLDPPPVAAPAPTLDEAKAAKLRAVSDESLGRRAALLPDYQLLNAGLGLYDSARLLTIRATVQAFRDEARRIETAVAQATTVQAVQALQPAFPTALVVPAVPSPPSRLQQIEQDTWGKSGPV